jgi:hypothetical protein
MVNGTDALETLAHVAGLEGAYQAQTSHVGSAKGLGGRSADPSVPKSLNN